MKKTLFLIFISLLFANVNAYTEAPIDITSMNITKIKEALDLGLVTSEQLVTMYLERIDAYDDKFNAVREINKNAIEEAKEKDIERSSGKIKGKLHGIPFLIKNNIDAKGLATTAGTKSLGDNYPNEDSKVVRLLKEEGAIVLGTTNMSELAFVAANSYSSYGNVKNVFNTDYTPFGSSGGSAVSVKAAFAPFALGTDTNLSVRVPASAAGIVGLRPTQKSVSMEGVIPYDTQRDTVGVLAPTVLDTALIYSIISGLELNTDKKEYTIGIITEYTEGSTKESGVLGETDKDIQNLIKGSLNVLEASGIKLVYLNDFVKSSNLTIASTSASGLTLCDGFNNYIKNTTGTIRSFKELANSSGHIQSLTEYLSYCGKSQDYIEKKDNDKKIYRGYVDDIFEKYNLDALLYPTLKNKVPVLNKGGANSPGGSLGSVIGYPSITIPMGNIDEFSYGIEFLARSNNENTLFNIGSIFESSNKNKIETSVLTPPLYQVSKEVQDLMNVYKDNQSNEKVASLAKEFFKDYNNIRNKTERAIELIKEFNKKDYRVLYYILSNIVLIGTYICFIYHIKKRLSN